MPRFEISWTSTKIVEAANKEEAFENVTPDGAERDAYEIRELDDDENTEKR